MDDDREGLDIYEDTSLGIHTKTSKDRSPFTILTPSHLRTRFLNSLSLPSKKGRSPSDTKGTTNVGKFPEELRLMQRNRTKTEPSNFSPGQSGQSEVFYNGSRVPRSPTVSLETSFVGIKALAELYGAEGCSDLEGRGQHKSVTPGDGQRERSSREHLACDGASVLPGGGTFKSRSHSFNTDTTTSGISSMSSSPSREPASSISMDTDCASLNTVVSAKTLKMQHSLSAQSNHNHILLSKSTSLVPLGSAHTLPRRAQSLKSPSVATIKSPVDCSYIYTSPRDALGYATLKRLQQQRIHPSLSHGEALTSPAKDVLFTDTITMKTRSLDSRLTPRRYTEVISAVSSVI